MYYVYILKSKVRDWRYVGFTHDLKKRFKQHNEGKSTATKNYKPFDLVCYVAVKDKATAIKLEKYLKTGSGIAWMNKRLMPG
ncbi:MULTISPECIES: GIY-YIG nuclease family protein [Gracilimonas]|uniref:GIY-YIG nuclease family protein n=1 Tax=Gracilimonas sediminicola TaxID=2952158 RepID=A0A9X2RI30_9BACT|nr:GIY-YIG nuclease family protein [Gracilimonas sediminicola]MCP9292454.1 GIY-YIG nuclease family protein [Gracilimonas sediminicola]